MKVGNDMLSQQEIDALLKQSQSTASDTTNEDSLQITDYLNELERDAIGEIGNISFGTAATALSTLLRQKVEITTPTVSVVSKQTLVADFPLPHVAIKVEYTDGFVGANVLVIRIQDAKIIADLMMGGDGTSVDDAELTELHLSAVAEAMNQMMGSASTSMSTVFSMLVNITPPIVEIVDFSNPQATDLFPGEDILIKVSFRLIVGNLIDSNIMQLIPVPFAKTMLSMLNMGGMSAPAGNEEKVPQVETSHSQPIPEPSRVAPVVDSRKNMPAPSVNQQTPGYTEPVHENRVTASPAPSVPVQPVQFASFDRQDLSGSAPGNIDLLLDIPLQVSVELGRTRKEIREILQLTPGSIIELDKVAGEPVDILVNQKLVAKGEVVVIDENFGVRVTDIITPMERMQKLKN